MLFIQTDEQSSRRFRFGSQSIVLPAKGGKMGKMDVLLKSYLGDARRYADLWNGGLFCGRQIVKAEEL